MTTETCLITSYCISITEMTTEICLIYLESSWPLYFISVGTTSLPRRSRWLTTTWRWYRWLPRRVIFKLVYLVKGDDYRDMSYIFRKLMTPTVHSWWYQIIVKRIKVNNKSLEDGVHDRQEGSFWSYCISWMEMNTETCLIYLESSRALQFRFGDTKSLLKNLRWRTTTWRWCTRSQGRVIFKLLYLENGDYYRYISYIF